MGSYDFAVMTGFICRLCSELNGNVVHIYSDMGLNLRLAQKINSIPISVTPQDNLPKTVCRTCINRLNSHYSLIQQMKRSRERVLNYQRHNCEHPLHSGSESDTEDSEAEPQRRRRRNNLDNAASPL